MIDPKSAKEKLTSEQITEFQTAFDLFASDGSTIENESLKAIFKNLGQEMSDAELDAMVKEVDQDGSGEIDFDEFLGMMVSLLGLDVDDAKDAFKCMDSDNSGFILMSDLESVMKSCKEKLTEAEIAAITKECDPDCSGKCNLETFKKVFCF